MLRRTRDRERADVQALTRRRGVIGEHIDRDRLVNGAHRGIVLRGWVLIERRAIVGAEAVAIDDEDVRGTVPHECPDGHGSAIAAVGRRGNVDRRDVGERVCGAVVEIDRADRRVRGRR